jgi:hypothetical protein
LIAQTETGPVAKLGLNSGVVRTVCVVVCLVALSSGVAEGQQVNGQANGNPNGASNGTATGNPNEKTVLRGTVVNVITHEPIGRAVVKSQDGRYARMTNERGRFEMVFKEKKECSARGHDSGHSR